MKITYKYRVKDKHAAALNRHARAVNFVWNFCNETQKHALKWGKKWPSGYDLEKLTAGSSKEIGIQTEIIGKVCHQYEKSRRQHCKAYLRYRGKKSLGWIPVKGRCVRASGESIIVHSKSYSVWLSRPIPEGAKICDGSSFSQDSRGRWHLNLVLDIAEVTTRDTNRSVGIDLGLKDLAVLSTGERIAAPRIYRSTQDRLATAQRARKKRQVKAIHAKIQNQRKDFLHKITTDIVNRFDHIVVGNVNASALAQTTMAKSVLDAGWSTLRNNLRYKSIRNGVRYEEVNEAYSSQSCSACGSISGPKGREGLAVRQWVCGECGCDHDRDLNASINILARGRQATLVAGAA